MKRLLLGALFTIPLGVFFIAGALWMWERSLLLAGGIVAIACWTAGLILLRRWLSRLGYPHPIPDDWTARDREAMALVEAREASLLEASTDDLADRSFQEKIVYDLALQLARHYHPESEDPLAPLTPRQLVVAARVMADDAGDWLDYYFPGNRIVTIGQFRRLGELPWWISAVAKWTSIVARWGRSGGDSSGVGATETRGVEPSARLAGGKMPVLVARVLLRRLGVRLIDLYAGRLQDDQRDQTRAQRVAAESSLESPGSNQVTIAFVGEPGSGKSAMIRAMLGEGRSTRDRLPGATHVSRYRVQLGEPFARLVVLEADLVLNTIARDLRWIAEKCDLVVFVCKVTGSKDEARAILRTLLQNGAGPPVVTALSHVDQIAEVPARAGRAFDIDQMRTIKESIAPWEAEFEAMSTDFAAVFTESGQWIGVDEWLVPAIVRQLSEVKANILLHAIAPSESEEASN